MAPKPARGMTRQLAQRRAVGRVRPHNPFITRKPLPWTNRFPAQGGAEQRRFHRSAFAIGISYRRDLATNVLHSHEKRGVASGLHAESWRTKGRFEKRNASCANTIERRTRVRREDEPWSAD